MCGFKKGILYELFAYIVWGLLPLYWHLLDFISPFHILGFRITLSLVFTAIVLFFLRNSGWIRLLAAKESRLWVIAAGLVISFNWGLYIWAVNTGHTIDASLGYYINPLVSIVLGLVFLRERLSELQWTAFGFALAGVVLMAVFSGVFPAIALLLALSFGLYGLIKKKTHAAVLEALSAETLAALPIGIALLALPVSQLPELGALKPLQWALIAPAGAVTAIPLLAFAQGAKYLSLSTVGFLQFINPTILFFLGVFVFDEPFPPRNLIAFGLIWVAVILYCFSLRKKA
jgi:chloramphenicol-sensitive protein RarD